MRATLRLARREILQHRWRSLLVIVLIGLPILASVAAVTLVETGTIDDAERRPYNFGAAAELIASGYDDDSDVPASPPPSEEATARTLANLIGSTPVGRNWQQGWLGFGKVGARVDVLRTDFASPLTQGIVDPISGRLPTEPDEIAITPRLSHEGVGVGDTATIGGTTVHVVGVARAMDQGLVVAEGALLPASSPATFAEDEGRVSWSFLAGGPDEPPLSDDQREALTKAGFHVTARTATIDSGGLGNEAQDNQLIALLVTCLLIEIVLLAGPAFAVGVRRQRRTLALLAVAGGSPRTIRRTVLAQGLLLGLGAAVVGAALAIPLTWLGLRLVFSWSGTDLGPFDIGWLAVGPAVGFGVISALLACVVPARAAAKADVVTALSGRQPTPRVRAGWPVAGAVVLAVGTLGCLASLGRDYRGGDFANAWWAVVSVCGAVMMTPWLIAAIAKLAPRMPLPLRLALRDADRHRSRSAPAVAAVMASVSAVVALGIGSGSDAIGNDRSGTYDQPIGRVVLSAETAPLLDQLAEAIRTESGVTFTPLHQVTNTNLSPAGSAAGGFTVAVADEATLKAWGVTLSAVEADALRSGTALAAEGMPINDGKVTIGRWNSDGDELPALSVPAITTDLEMAGEIPGGPRPLVAGVVLSEETAQRLGLDYRDSWTTAVADRPAAEADSVAVRSVVASLDPLGAELSVSTKHRSNYWILLALLSGLAVFTVLLGTFSATGLALDDAKQDLATLSAVGARPRTRRVVAGAHAFLIALLGASLGIAVGFTPGIAAAYLLTDGTPGGWVFHVPWLLLLILLVVLPLIAGTVTALVSRTRIASLRRAA